MRLLLTALLLAGCQDWYDPDWIPCWSDDNCDAPNVCVGGGGIEDSQVGACHSEDAFDEDAVPALLGWRTDPNSGFHHADLLVGENGVDCATLDAFLNQASDAADLPWIGLSLFVAGGPDWDTLYTTVFGDACVKGEPTLSCIVDAQLFQGSTPVAAIDDPQMTLRLSDFSDSSLRGTFQTSQEGVFASSADGAIDFSGEVCGFLGDYQVAAR